MEEMFTDLIMLVMLLGGAKVLIFHLLGKAKHEMAASRSTTKDGGNVIKLDHYKYIYSQEEIYNSMYPKVRDKFKKAMRYGLLTNDQVRFIERYLRDSLNDKRRYRNNAHCIYTLLQSVELDNSHYAYLNQVLDDFIAR